MSILFLLITHYFSLFATTKLEKNQKKLSLMASVGYLPSEMLAQWNLFFCSFHRGEDYSTGVCQIWPGR